VEFSHRLAVALTTPAVVAAAALGWARRRDHPDEARLAVLAAGLLAVQIGLGALTVRLELPPEIVAVHLGLALLILALEAGSSASVAVRLRARASTGARQWPVRHVLSLLAVLTALVTGVLVAAGGARFACSGWPLCSGELLPAHTLGRLHMLHRGAVLLAAAMVLLAVAEEWKHRYSRPAASIAAVLAGTLFAAQVAIGAAGVLRGFPAGVVGMHVAVGSAAWACLVISFTISSHAGREVEPSRLRGGLADFLALTKPWIVGLLLVTTAAGMIVGQRGWPGWGKVGWTLLGGALAAGGASALNQYIDRKQDVLMPRTRRRPLPRGSLAPAEAIAFGLVCCLAGFFVLALAVNLLSAVLALAGMLYYVLFYSLVLKPSTPQNIVVGGGAGAIPPLVGWAAATGRLEWSSLFLFALVFFWTPAHFWALALVRREEYQQAGVPMLPVVYGERETRRHILLYSFQVVILTLLLPVARLGGWLYAAAALLLGGLLLLRAWDLWVAGGLRRAWRLYKYSSAYLALILGALVADTLLRA
jgi:protoheme IX farnesyltransferase